ncbi:MAG: hypothetical protein KDA83_00140 [Planctomycetales bacterium]|nr:hypothetical protein [Planctomycetales bacterium]
MDAQDRSTTPSRTSTPRAQAAQLLDHQWDRTTEAADAVEQFAADVERFAESDAQVRYALGLLQLRQLEYRDAVANFEAALRATPDDTQLLKAVIWGQILTRQPRQATVRLAPLARALADRSEPDRDDLQFLGLMIGFLGLPTDASVNERELNRQVRQIEETLSEDQFTIVQNAVEEVQLTFEALEAERTVEREDATVEAERNRETELERLANEKVELKDQAGDLDSRIADVTRQRNEALAEIRERDAPLQAQWNQAASTVRGLDARIFDVQQAIWQLNRLLARERDQILRGRWLFELGRLQFILNDLSAERVSAASYADGIAAQRVAIANQYAAVQSDYDSQLNQLNSDRQNVRRRETIADARTRRLQGPLRVVSGRAESFGREARSLSTYYEYPIESERLRLIGEFTAPTTRRDDKDAAEGTDDDSTDAAEPGDSLILDGRGGE